MKTLFNKRILVVFVTVLLIVASINNGCQKADESTTTSSGKSNIIYTDVNPDSIILSTTQQLYSLDLDGDGTADFIFTEKGRVPTNCNHNQTESNGFTYSAGVRPAGVDARPSGGANNAMVFNGSWLIALDSLAVIDSNADWTNDTIGRMLYVNQIGQTIICDPPNGPWNYTSNKYLGLRIIKKGNSYYGWARIFKTDPTSMILTGYAYNSNPNQGIFAGQTK